MFHLGVFGHHFAGKFFQHVSFGIFLLLEDGIEEPPAHRRIRPIRFEKMDRHLGGALVQRHDYRTHREGKLFLHRLAHGFLASARFCRSGQRDAAFKRLRLPCRRAAIGFDLRAPGCGGAFQAQAVRFKDVDDLRPLRGNNIGTRRRNRKHWLKPALARHVLLPWLVAVLNANGAGNFA